ncbi:hypothetical protein PPERSA_05175 [Pseudocohnilembus persalinus]|uniref:Uncharacterized protein n=1 Tax=Pseudocohnilembus persalinus TaxID=266149 RepID=A0A0V0R9U2_PSEPJ|nr:hypothetical protein PPERSA_05175 [Pseudocohnilembus persalinus]|eukprot:KRX11066.1 hypothetical protein PPERSA_05175 [Pseudocohnilembus persalinus]
MSNEETQQVEKYLQQIKIREKQIDSMQDMLTELEQNLKDAKKKCDNDQENFQLLKRQLRLKEQLLKDQLQEKEIIFAKLLTEESLNDKYQQQIIQIQGQKKSFF